MSSDDRLLEELARLARAERDAERQRLDERWDALAAGDLDAGEEAELRGAASSTEDREVAWEAFRPFDDAFDQRLAEAARRQLGTRPDNVVRGPWRRRLPAALLAAAAVLALLLRFPGTPEPLPDYALRLEGSVRTLRSSGAAETSERPLFVPGNRLRLVLTPESTVEGKAVARAWLVREGELAELDPPRVSEDGAVLFEATVLEATDLAEDDGGTGLRLPIGDSTLVVAVGRPGELPGVAEVLAALGEDGSARGETWAAWAVALRMERGSAPTQGEGRPLPPRGHRPLL